MIRILQISTEISAQCKTQEQILEDIFQDEKFKIPFIFVKINIDNNNKLKKIYQIIKVPTLLFLVDDTVIDRTEGLLLKSHVINKIKNINNMKGYK
jgi:thioredoxin-like negative regulator of GroEL